LEPILNSGLGEWGLHLGAAGLTAFNDNALITFLASQVPGLSESAKYVILAGAVAGGGLTVIANAPNPAGQSLLKKYFSGGISPLGLFLGALIPTIIAICCFMLLPR
jgi:di/tricarboxylate transporter